MLITDLHIHGRHSRGCSKSLSIPLLEKWAKIKGIDILGTGDFQHPLWQKHIKDNLVSESNGIYSTKTGMDFILTTELSLMYSQGGKGRRIHFLVLAPNMDIASQITAELAKKGRLDYDGRPIFGFSAIDLVDMMKSIDDGIEIIPAHAWTPWFGIFGSKSGFDSLAECFADNSRHIHAIETGMSSDPQMNWRISGLDKINMVSFSDAHSFWPWRLGREATVFDTNKSYKAILSAIRTGNGIAETIEVDPSYGKYHYSGHRNCGVCMSPLEAKKTKGICPKCGKKLVSGVAERIENLASRDESCKRKNAPVFRRVLPLSEVLSLAENSGASSKKVWQIYNNLVNHFGTEMNVLLKAEENEMNKIVSKKISSLIIANRNEKIRVKPGFDGEYGKPLAGS